MSAITDAIRGHHREIDAKITETAERALGRGTIADIEALVAVLRDELLPHAKGEEARLYPAIDPVVAAHARPTATMSIDHEHIQAYVTTIAGALEAARRAATEAERRSAAGALRDAVLRLRALLAVHLEKEERVYLPLVDRYLSDAEQAKLLEGIHETAERTKEVAR